MEALGSLIVVVGFLACVVGFIALIRPLPSFGLPSRRRAALVLIGSLLAILVGGALVPSPTPPPPSVRDAGQTSRPAQTSADLNVEFRELFQNATHEIEACDDVADDVRRLQTRPEEAQALYEALVGAGETCKVNARNFSDLKPPSGLSGPQRRALQDALEDCRSQYRAKAGVYEDLADVLDKGASRSRISEVKSWMKDSEMARSRCRAGLLRAAKVAGVSSEMLLAK